MLYASTLEWPTAPTVFDPHGVRVWLCHGGCERNYTVGVPGL